MVKCEHDPVEQVRQDMGAGDYFDAVTNSQDEPKFARLSDDYHQFVELHDENRTDARIICRKCFLSTGWMKADVPGLPVGAGLPYIRGRWDEIKQYDVEQLAAIERAKAVKSSTANFGS